MEDIFDGVSALDFRYLRKQRDIRRILSETAFTNRKLEVEGALIRALANRGICPQPDTDVLSAAIASVDTASVYQGEDEIGHDIRALVNRFRTFLPPTLQPFAHYLATSYDVVDTANALRYRAAVLELLLPALYQLERTLIGLARKHAATVQIGRTHGKHAVPLTFGFAIAVYAQRLGVCIEGIRAAVAHLEGKFSGAVGAYNATALVFDDPEAFESHVLGLLGLRPTPIATQIVPPERVQRLLSEVFMAAGVMANIADDMRNLTRTEIGEVSELFGRNQVGSSTMPQKRNPIRLESVKSMWKILLGRMVTLFLDQLSDHQRDLTNSASSRTITEIFAYSTVMARTLGKVMAGLKVFPERMRKNLDDAGDSILAEPLYILLASKGHQDAHEVVREMTLQQERDGGSLIALAREREDLAPFTGRFTGRQWGALEDSSHYIGIAATKAPVIAETWERWLAENPLEEQTA